MLKLQNRKFKDKYNRLSQFRETNLSVEWFDNTSQVIRQLGENDILLAGSDQIWSMANGGISAWYTFQWNGLPDTVGKYSYAASIGLSTLSDLQKEKYRKALHGFKVISFREQQAERLLSPCLNSEVRCDLDPTLLYNGSFWETVAAPRKVQEPYIFIYMLRPDKRLISMGKSVAKQLHCKVIYTGLMADRFPGVDTICDAGIEDYLSFIKHAEGVITNSFHGTVFSILFQKKFVSVKLEGTSSRAENLLDMLDLKNQYITEEEEISKIFDTIDYSPALKKLEKEREKSKEYIRRICSSPNLGEVDQMYLKSKLKQECTGCTACMVNCPVQAIKMKNAKGFLYPEIDKEKCIHCGLCERTCQEIKGQLLQKEKRAIFYGWNKDEKNRWNSTSGGAFSAIVEAFLKLYPEGWVYGAVYDEFLRVVHVGTRDRGKIREMCRSKYLQSDITGIFQEVLDHLKKRQHVLFSGTPCQVAGLKALAGKYTEYLITVDMICHGVSNPDYFSAYLKSLEKRNHSQLRSYSFRNKSKSNFQKSFRLVRTEYENGKKLITDRDLYIISYKLRLFYRDSCYGCPFASESRCSDFTLGDFWGLENEIKELKRQRLPGLSMVCFNSDMSMRFIDAIAEVFELKKYEGDFDRYHNLFIPTARPAGSDPREYNTNSDFIDYLQTIVSPTDVWKYAHPKSVKLITATKRKLSKLFH